MWQSESGTETILVGQTSSLGPLQLLAAYLTSWTNWPALDTQFKDHICS